MPATRTTINKTSTAMAMIRCRLVLVFLVESGCIVECDAVVVLKLNKEGLYADAPHTIIKIEY